MGGIQARIRRIIGFILLVSCATTSCRTSLVLVKLMVLMTGIGILGRCTEFPYKSTRPTEVELQEAPGNTTSDDGVSMGDVTQTGFTVGSTGSMNS